MANASSHGDYSADDYVKTAPYVFSDAYTASILSWLNAGHGDRIIDLGCGSGELTVKIQDAVGVEGFVLGVDYSEDMVGRCVPSRDDFSMEMLCTGVQSQNERRQEYPRVRRSGP